MIDIDRIRANTPAVARLIYLHNAGAALMPIPVVEAVKRHIDLEAEIGGYAAGQRESDRLQAVYGSVARLVNARPDEIALTENATAAWQMAFYALPFREGDRILTAEAEYAANYVAYLHVAKRTGAIVDVVPSDDSGELDVGALESMLDARVKLIAITWIPTNGGLVNPAAAVGKIARARGIPYLLDACQAMGQLAVDVDAGGIFGGVTDAMSIALDRSTPGLGCHHSSLPPMRVPEPRFRTPLSRSASFHAHLLQAPPTNTRAAASGECDAFRHITFPCRFSCSARDAGNGRG